MKVSIVIPYYNGEQWVGKCLDSLLMQDLKTDEYEIIVVDDGSTHSIESLMSYVNDYPHIHYIHQRNQKHAAARNYGLTIAQGDYVFFCDCDDFVAENVLGRLCDLATSESADILLFNSRSIEENESPPLPKKNFDDIKVFESGMAYMSQPPYHFTGGVWQFLIRRGFMEEKNVRFAPEMVNCEEYLFFLQMLLASGKVLKVDVDVYYYVQHPTSWVHLEGKVYHSEAFVGCMLSYLKFLTRIRKQLTEEGKGSSGLLEAMQNNEVLNTLCILSNKLRFSSIKANKEMIDQLSRLGYYPIHRKIGKYDWIRRIANVYYLWMALCCCYHLMPYKLSNKVVSLLKKIQ
jgi:glycosyltransferase involved in cell wall biosynthesis